MGKIICVLLLLLSLSYKRMRLDECKNVGIHLDTGNLQENPPLISFLLHRLWSILHKDKHK